MKQPKSWTKNLTQDNLELIARLERGVREARSWDDRMIDSVVAWFGSKSFAYANALVFALWIGANSKLWSAHPYDPFPFEFLTLAVSLEAIFLSIFLLISQNRERIWSERRSHLDLQLNLLAEQETTATMQLLLKIAEKLDIPTNEFPNDMLEQIEPEQILERLDQLES